MPLIHFIFSMRDIFIRSSWSIWLQVVWFLSVVLCQVALPAKQGMTLLTLHTFFLNTCSSRWLIAGQKFALILFGPCLFWKVFAELPQCSCPHPPPPSTQRHRSMQDSPSPLLPANPGPFPCLLFLFIPLSASSPCYEVALRMAGVRAIVCTDLLFHLFGS